jgi:hypothetical protein
MFRQILVKLPNIKLRGNIFSFSHTIYDLNELLNVPANFSKTSQYKFRGNRFRFFHALRVQRNFGCSRKF